eukprot:411301-Pyramimonas_sp.AAC.1
MALCVCWTALPCSIPSQGAFTKGLECRGGYYWVGFSALYPHPSLQVLRSAWRIACGAGSST